jgi:hypothetical protein
MEYYHDLSKTNLRKKDVEILGANWDNRILYCKQCGWQDDPFIQQPPQSRPGTA